MPETTTKMKYVVWDDVWTLPNRSGITSKNRTGSERCAGSGASETINYRLCSKGTDYMPASVFSASHKDQGKSLQAHKRSDIAGICDRWRC